MDNPYDTLFLREHETLTLPAPATLPAALKRYLRSGRLEIPVERRLNPVTGEWTHLNAARAQRPIEDGTAESDDTGADRCAFCPGQEARTPEGTEVDAAWNLRSFANLYPWLIEHRNIVHTREHRVGLHDANGEEEASALQQAAQETRDLRRRGLFPVVFRNAGPGASQPHAHWQLGALARWSRRDAMIFDRLSAFHAEHGRNLFDVLWTEEEARAERFLGCVGTWAVFCPFAPRHEHEVWMVSTLERAALDECDALELRAAGHTLAALLSGLARNLGVRGASVCARQLPGEPCVYRLCLEICPETVWAGAERGFEEYAVDHPPEQTASLLRGPFQFARAEIIDRLDDIEQEDRLE